MSLTVQCCTFETAQFTRKSHDGEQPRKERREYKYFNSSVVMLVYYIFEIDAGGNYQSKSLPEAFRLIMLHTGFSL